MSVVWNNTFGCPACNAVTAYFYAGAATLAGFDEFIYSTPRKRYRKYTISGTVNTHVTGRSPHATDTDTGNGLSANYFNADGSETATSYSDISHTDGNYFAWSTVAQPPPAAPTFWWDPFEGTNTSNTSSTTQVWTPVATGAGNTASGSLTCTLSEEDLPSDAIERLLDYLIGSLTTIYNTTGVPADIFADGIFSLQETANDTPGYECTFGFQGGPTKTDGGTIDLGFVNLAPGANYHYIVVFEERAAVGDGTGDTSGYGSTWANSDTLSGDFTASATSQWVTALIMPLAAGKQKRIKSISITAV